MISFPVNAEKLASGLSAALDTVLGQPSYQEKASELSALMRARRWTPAEEAASALPQLRLMWLTIRLTKQQDWFVDLLGLHVDQRL